MIVDVGLPEVLTAASVATTITIAVSKLLLRAVDRSLDERFKAMGARFKGMEEQSKSWAKLERDFLKFQADLPVHYVRREDYVRNQSVIEAKLDAIAGELKRVQIDGAQQGIRYDS